MLQFAAKLEISFGAKSCIIVKIINSQMILQSPDMQILLVENKQASKQTNDH